LRYLTIEEMLEVVYDDFAEDFCTACFSGNYPIQFDSSFRKDIYED